MGETYFIDRLPKWLAFAIQALCMYLFFWFWVAFFLLPPFLYYGSTTTKIILCFQLNFLKINTFIGTILVYQYTICKESQIYRRINKELRLENYFSDYKITFEDEITPKKKQLFCSHPHALMAIGLGLAHQNEPRFSYNNYLGATILNYLPFSGIFFRLYGVKSVGKSNFTKLMKNEENIYFVPGGFECATNTKYGIDRVYIKNRKGFIKYALQFGYNVHPCYCFGENQIYQGIGQLLQFFNLIKGVGSKLGYILNKFSIPAIFPFSYYLQFPYRPKLYPIIGKGIQFPIIKKPSENDIDKYHEIYVKALVALFDKYKKQFGGCDQLELL